MTEAGPCGWRSGAAKVGTRPVSPQGHADDDHHGREGLPKEEEDDALHIAMLSVYYRSLGSELESRGAPVMAVPPQVRPMPLDEALDCLKGRPDLLWDAYWRVVRSVPVEGWKRRSLERRYPQAFVDDWVLDR